MISFEKIISIFHEHKKKIFIAVLAGVSFSIIYSSLVYLLKNNSNKKLPGNILSIETARVTKKDFEVTFDSIGTISYRDKATISSKILGRVEKIYVEPGDRVKKGDLLVKMDQSQLIQTQIQFEDTKKDLERMDTLIQYGSISNQTYDKAKMGYELAKTGLETLKENVNLYAP